MVYIYALVGVASIKTTAPLTARHARMVGATCFVVTASRTYGSNIGLKSARRVFKE